LDPEERKNKSLKRKKKEKFRGKRGGKGERGRELYIAFYSFLF